MSVENQTRARERDAYSDDRSGGWLLFAGVMLLIVGTMNFIGGIAAIDGAHFYVANANYVFSDLSTWGWVILITGVGQMVPGVGVLAGNQLARWLGVFFASLNMIGQFFFFPSQPLWSLSFIAIDTLIIYGLLAHGRDEAAR